MIFTCIALWRNTEVYNFRISSKCIKQILRIKKKARKQIKYLKGILRLFKLELE